MNWQCNLRLRWITSLALTICLTATTPLSAELVGYWAMDEASWNGTSGEVLDSSGKDHHGTAANDADTTVDAERGTVGTFDGSGDHVLVPANQDFDLGDGGTISCWVKFDDLPKNTHQIIGGTNYHQTFLLNQYGYTGDSEPYGDRLYVYWGSTGGPQTTTSYGTFGFDTWQHLAVTNDNGSLTVYVDGTVKATGSQGPTAYNWNTPIGIGGRSNGSWTIDGYIDDVAIWTGALDPELIAVLANGASPLSIPEPSTFLLAAFGLLGLAISRRARRR